MSSKKPIEDQEFEIVEGKKVQLFNAKVVVADVATAAIIAGSAAIPISIIDYAIMAKVAGVVPSMMHQVKAGFSCLFKTPANFFLHNRPGAPYATVYRLCAGVYVGTYVVANVTRSFSEGYAKDASPESVAFKCGVTSSAVNIGLTIWKDVNILKVIPKNPTAAAATTTVEKVFVPMLSRLGFAVRDAATCIAAFTVVPLLKDYLYTNHSDRFSERSCQSIASLFTPCSIQIATTGIHIPAIVYQRMYRPDRRWAGPEGYTAGMVAAMKRDYSGALRMRVLRICVAFGFGGIGNYELRPKLLKILEPKVFQYKKLKGAAASTDGH